MQGHHSWDLGTVHTGDVVDVTLFGAECDVLLLRPDDFRRFLGARPFTFVGGHFQSSRVRLRIPSAGTWHVVVVPSPSGTVQATVQLRGAA